MADPWAQWQGYQPPTQTGPTNPTWGVYQQGVLDPYNANADVSVARQMGQMGQVGAYYGTQSGLLNQQLGYGLQGIGIDERDLAVAQGALGRQGPLTEQQFNLQNQLYGLSKADVEQGKQQAQVGAQQQQRSAWSGATGRGATITSGFRTDLGNIDQQLQFALSGLNRQGERIDIGQQQTALNYNEQKAQLVDQDKRLGLAAEKLGLQKDQLRNQIAQSLNQLGLSNVLTVGQIATAIDDINNGRYSVLSGILPQVLASGGIQMSGSPPGWGKTGGADVNRIAGAISGNESGGNYGATNSRTGASGRYQIMPSNWPQWSQQAGLGANAARTPENQDKVALYKMNEYMNTFGDPRAVAVAWYAGPAAAKAWQNNPNAARFNSRPAPGEPSINEYVAKFWKRYSG